MFYCAPILESSRDSRRNSPRSALGTRLSRGFTLIELLVVIAIIGILVALLLPVLANVRRNAKEAATRALIKSLETAIAAYEFDWGQFPPDGYASIPGPPVVPVKGYDSAGTSFNIRSSSALFYYLSSPFRVTPNAAKGEIWGSKDCGPYLDVPVPNQKISAVDPKGIDIIDVFGRPLQYDNIRDPQASASGFDATPATANSKEIRNDATLVTPNPQHPGNPACNLQGVDIFSLGTGGGTICTRPVANFRCIWEQ
jgi:prepilin-type N-terminal cleavage/methylation domain-containing protein